MYRNEEKTLVVKSGASSLSLGTIGFITWIVFLVLKLCNMDNPDFAWLTWFWVWFPFWLPFAIGGLFLILACICALIVAGASDN